MKRAPDLRAMLTLRHVTMPGSIRAPWDYKKKLEPTQLDTTGSQRSTSLPECRAPQNQGRSRRGPAAIPAIPAIATTSSV